MPSVQAAGILMIIGLPFLIVWWTRPFRRFLVFDPGRGLVHVPRFWGGVDRVRFQDLDFVILDTPNMTGTHVSSIIYMVRPGKPLVGGMGEINKLVRFYFKHRPNLVLVQHTPSIRDARRYWQFLVEFMRGEVDDPNPEFMARQMKDLPTFRMSSIVEIWSPQARHFDPETLGDDLTWWKDEEGRWWQVEERPEPEARRRAAEAALAPVRRKIAERRTQLKEHRVQERHFVRGDLLEGYFEGMEDKIPRREVRKLRRLWEQHVPPQDRVGGLGIAPRDFDAVVPKLKELLGAHPAVAEGRWWRSFDADQETIRYHIALTPFRGVAPDDEALSKARQAIEAALPPHIRSDVDVNSDADHAPESIFPFYRRALSDQRRAASSA